VANWQSICVIIKLIQEVKALAKVNESLLGVARSMACAYDYGDTLTTTVDVLGSLRQIALTLYGRANYKEVMKREQQALDDEGGHVEGALVLMKSFQQSTYTSRGATSSAGGEVSVGVGSDCKKPGQPAQALVHHLREVAGCTGTPPLDERVAQAANEQGASGSTDDNQAHVPHV
jgi:hypothetical protein